MTNFIMEEENKEKKEDILLKKPNEPEANKIDNNIKAKVDMNINKENQIANFKPNITEPKKKEEGVFVETTVIKDTQKNKDNINQNVPYDSSMAKEKNINNVNKAIKHEDVPYDSSMAKINKKKDESTIKISNEFNNQKNEGNVKTDQHIDAPYSSTQAIAQPNLNNNGTQINQNVNNLQNLNNNDNLAMPYNSGMSLVPQNQNVNTINNTNYINNVNNNANNNVNNYDTGYNSVVGPTYNIINTNQDKNKFPDMPYTSNMANTNNIPPIQNVPTNQIVNTGFSERQGIYSQEPNKEVKPEINPSLNKLKESEVVEEKKENGETKVENNKINDKTENVNNNTTVVKESIISAGNPNDESRQFDELMKKEKN